jgi:hypothetical protein
MPAQDARIKRRMSRQAQVSLVLLGFVRLLAMKKHQANKRFGTPRPSESL